MKGLQRVRWVQDVLSRILFSWKKWQPLCQTAFSWSEVAVHSLRPRPSKNQQDNLSQGGFLHQGQPWRR
eukprot:scaffold250004_cov39-Prasinocladus_malaysianus.AAC.1